MKADFNEIKTLNYFCL